mgnify:CR=1 FL=1
MRRRMLRAHRRRATAVALCFAVASWLAVRSPSHRGACISRSTLHRARRLRLRSSRDARGSAVDSVSGGPGYEYLGFGFAPLGDLDGDGFGEAALGGLAYYGQPGVVLIEGSRSGVSGVTHARMDAAGDAECCFSPTAGDSDGDGFSDLVVGAWLGDLSGPSWAAVLRGSAGGIEATPSTLLYDPTPVADRSTYGSHLSFVGDLEIGRAHV